MKVAMLIMSGILNASMLLPRGFADEATGPRLSAEMEKALKLYCQGNYDAANLVAAKATEPAPHDFVALCIRADVTAGSPSVPSWSTMVAVNAALDANPDSLFALYLKASTLKTLGNKSDSESLLAKVTAAQPREGDWLDQFGKMRAYRMARNEKGALAAATETLRLVSDTPVLASYLFNWRGLIHALRYDYDKAIADYSAAICSNPENVFAYVNRAVTRNSQEQFADAIQDATEALRINPDYVQALTALAFAHSRQHDYDQAVAVLNRALKIEPKNAQVILNRAQLLVSMHDYSGAKGDAQKLEQLDPVGEFGQKARQLLKSLE